MSQNMSYQIPAETICVEQEIKRSRFITSMGRAPDKQQANAFIDNVRLTYPDANHHCWRSLPDDCCFDADNFQLADH